MMAVMFYDLETTGTGAPTIEHIVEAAAVLRDDNGRTLESFSFIVRPDGWLIPEDASDVHGITTQVAKVYGYYESWVARALERMSRHADVKVAHNEEFDDGMTREALRRYGFFDEVMRWSLVQSYCTKEHATERCQLKPTERMIAAGRYHYKSPSLAEAHTILLNEPLDEAHDAMADVLACMRIYDKLTSTVVTERH